MTNVCGELGDGIEMVKLPWKTILGLLLKSEHQGLIYKLASCDHKAKIVRLADVWKTCNKIRAAAYRVGLNLWDWYIPLDPEKNSLISESKFVSILAGPLRTVIGLSDKEIAQLADYFRTQDGRVLYAQMCEVIHGEDVPRPDTTELGDMLDARPPAPEPACHALGPEQTRRLRLLLAAIAARDLPLKPYFQDYELVAKSDGRITFAHFSRVLNYIGVLLSAADFGLLVRRFIKDAYTVDYVAFLLAVEEVAKNGIRGLGVDYMNPQLVMDTREDRPPSINLTRLSEPVARAPLDVRDIMLRVQRYVSQRQLRVSEFLRDYDPLNSGRITAQQFRRALDLMGLDWLQPREMLCLATQYTDPNDRDRVCWRTFEDDCDQVFTVKELEKHPTLALSSARAPPPPAARVRPAALDAAEAGLMRIKDKLRERSLDLRPIFRDYDMHNNGHISSSQLPRALARAALLLPRESLAALEECFCDDCGFYYVSFLDALGESFEQEAAPRELLPDLVQRFASARQGPPPEETDIVLILAKVKGKMVREGIRVLDFLSQFDLHKEQVIPRADFYRGLATSGLQLSPVEMDTLMEVFAAPNRRRYIEYARFASTVEEARTQSGLERAPLLTPVPHAPPPPAPHLDHEQRHRASVAMQKLARFPDRLSNVMEMFQDVDRENCGSIARTAFARVLQQRGAGSELSPRELELVCQCFGYERGCRNEVNYRAFVNALDLLYTVAKENPC